MAIKDWSTTAANNTGSDGFPEGMAPSLVNDRCRSLQASVRAWYEDPDWIDLGHTPSRVSATQFQVQSADYTSTYKANRRVKMVGDTTEYGTISTSTFSTDTTVTLVEGTVPTTLTQVYIGAPDSANPAYLPPRLYTGKKTATQSIANASATSLTWVDVLTDGGFSLVSNQVVVPAGVSYVRCTAKVQFATNTTGERKVSILQSGGVTGTMAMAASSANVNSGDVQLVADTGIIPVTAADVLYVQVYQTSTAALDVTADCGLTVEAIK